MELEAPDPSSKARAVIHYLPICPPGGWQTAFVAWGCPILLMPSKGMQRPARRSPAESSFRTASCADAVAALAGLRFSTLVPCRFATAPPPSACHSWCGLSVLCVAALRSSLFCWSRCAFCGPTKGALCRPRNENLRSQRTSDSLYRSSATSPTSP